MAVPIWAVRHVTLLWAWSQGHVCPTSSAKMAIGRDLPSCRSEYEHRSGRLAAPPKYRLRFVFNLFSLTCMSIWIRIADALSALASGETLSQVFDRLRTPPERTVGFAIAVIALGAKMAKADGQVTRDEVAAFRQIFHIPPEEEANAAKVFNLARQDVAGFESYAERISAMFENQREVLADLLEGLFHIAVADGDYHPNEDLFLQRVAEIFGLSEREFGRIRARHVLSVEPDPYEVLGVAPDSDPATIRAAWRDLVRKTHPDQMIARGVPAEAIKLAEKRMVAINRAWEQLRTN